ncbi:Leucine-rich repeat-containing protein 42, partial [Nipponia nippon]
QNWTRGMSYCLHSESHLDTGPIYVRENGKLHVVNQGAGGIQNVTPKTRSFRLFSRGFSVELCMNREDDRARRQRTDHFIFTYTKEGNLRYSAKSLFSLVLGYISDNVDHIDSLIGFPEQIAEKLFSAAEARQKFTEPVTGLRALQKFTEAYGNLVLCSLCLRNRYLVISEKLEEIKSFRELTCLDLSCCKLGDEHELLEHLTKEALSSVKRLLLKDNSLSDAGLRRMTAPVRVLKKGLENLLVLDLSCNPKITDVGIGYLLSFKKLNCLDISGSGLKDVNAVIKRIQMQIGLVHSKVPLKEFDHSNCKTEGWAEQTVLQWEQAVMEAIKPQDDLRSRTAALRFYGKTHRKEEVGKCKLVEAETKASGNLQFYKEKVQNCHVPLKKEVAGSHELKNNKKRALAEQERERTSKQKHLCLTVEDWDLLNTY